MFKATSRNIHTYPHKSYLPIFDRSTLECSSLLRMRKNKCLYYAEKSIMQEVKKNKKKNKKHLNVYLVSRLYIRDLNSPNQLTISL